MNALWKPVRVGRLELEHRLAMAPMTRARATPGGVPTERNAEYYAQRASLGLVITEGTQPSEDGQGYPLTPGLYNAEQAAGWRLTADAVHAAGGHLFIQLMHVGRIAHPDNRPHDRQAVAPSAVRPEATMFTASGLQPIPEPRALTTSEVRATVDDFRRAAVLAMTTGADGVEIHGGNGYLVHQFLSDNANVRGDEYGGSRENRTRFAVEVARAIAEEIGADRTGLRISPGNTMNDIAEADTHGTYTDLAGRLAELDLAYLHVLQVPHVDGNELLRSLRQIWPNTLIVNRSGRSREEIGADVASGLADIASIGTMALANPDLTHRLRTGAPLNQPDATTFYVAEAGYTDYPFLTAI
jgi:N-ethylmaleimide reductase